MAPSSSIPCASSTASTTARPTPRIPKRNFKRAVKRVYLRRRIREAYRLHKEILTEPMARRNQSMHLAFLYLDKNLNDFHFIEQKMVEALERLVKKTEPQETSES